MSAARNTTRVGPTAHYTAYTWYRNGMSHQALSTPLGQVLFRTLEIPVTAYRRLLGGPTLESILLQRHRIIDHLLDAAVTSGTVGQVLEIAGGLSPRGWSMSQRHASCDLTYVEGDLPGMAARKRQLLEDAGLRGDRHHVVPLDALVDAGPEALDAIAERLLDPQRGLAVITEGLLNYLDEPEVRGLWARIARLLRRHPSGLYLSELHLGCEVKRLGLLGAFRRVLGAFTGGRIHLHFETPADVVAALEQAGFTAQTLHRPVDFASVLPIPRTRGADLVRVLEASVHGPGRVSSSADPTVT